MVWAIQRLSSLRNRSPVGVAQLLSVRYRSHHARLRYTLVDISLGSRTCVRVVWLVRHRHEFQDCVCLVCTSRAFLMDSPRWWIFCARGDGALSSATDSPVSMDTFGH